MILIRRISLLEESECMRKTVMQNVAVSVNRFCNIKKISLKSPAAMQISFSLIDVCIQMYEATVREKMSDPNWKRSSIFVTI